MFTEDVHYNAFLWGILLAAIGTVIALFFFNAPYGRHTRSGWGPEIPIRLGWVLMEAPASVVFLFFYFKGPNWQATPAIILMLMWQLHYAHRGFIYPFQIKVKPNAKSPLSIFLLGAIFCSINGYLNGDYISRLSPNMNQAWLSDPRFILGIIIFAVGYYINKRSDAILQNLRRNTLEGYQIPQGFLFRYVSMPNYLGELITWTGFAIASWSPAAGIFVLFTAANLIPRAIANHQWYHQYFDHYPPQRKIIIPFLF